MSPKQPHDDCPLAPDIDALVGSVKILAEKVDQLVSHNKEIVRVLMIVVCIIALGRGALDIGREIFGHTATAAVAENK
jgi:hypothetical protein